MNITTDDLDAAVAAGVVPASQADALRSFVAGRTHAPASHGMEDERFHFMRGFNDFFFAVGIVLLGTAMIFYLGNFALIYGDQPAVASAIWAIGAGLCWLLSELLVRRMRLVLPGILLSGLFLFFVFMAMPAIDIVEPFRVLSDAGPQSFLAQFRGVVLSAVPLKAAAATIALSLFYVRFRLPFTLLLIAGSLVIGIVATAALLLPRSFGGIPSESVILLLCGLGIFAIAMRFDLSDRLRVTRRADCAFWLHLLAAPLIVHSLVSIAALSMMSSRSTEGFGQSVSNMVGVTALIIVLLAFVAIVVDRRALLVSALAYLGAIIGYAITNAVGKDTNVFFATLLVLGVLVLTLGVGWRWLRGLVLRMLPAAAVDRLPPVTIGT